MGKWTDEVSGWDGEEKVMTDSCQNCGSEIPAHLEAEYCSKCADMEYGLTGGWKMKTITLSKGQDCWMADFEGDNEVMEAFGTTCIPTAFTLQANVRMLVRQLQSLNPHALIKVSA